VAWALVVFEPSIGVGDVFLLCAVWAVDEQVGLYVCEAFGRRAFDGERPFWELLGRVAVADFHPSVEAFVAEMALFVVPAGAVGVAENDVVFAAGDALDYLDEPFIFQVGRVQSAFSGPPEKLGGVLGVGGR